MASKRDPDFLAFLEGVREIRYFRATGHWPGEKSKPRKAKAG